MKVFTFYLCIVLTFCDANNVFNNSLQRSKRSNGEPCDFPSRGDEDKTYITNCDKILSITVLHEMRDGTTLRFICKPGYGHYKGGKNFTSVCTDGSWVPPIYPCLRTCAALKSAPDVKCYHNEQEIECGGEYLAGTTLQASCSDPFYHPNHKEIVCNGDGRWSVKNIKCVAYCGSHLNEAEYLEALEYLYKENYTKEAEELYENKRYLPWHVIVLKPGSISSGTLIAPHLVMCDATAVVDETGEPLPMEDLKISVNFSRGDRKKYEVKRVFFPPQGFRLHKNPTDGFVNDLAILNLAEKVEMSDTVMPVCVNRDSLHLPFDLSSVIGEVVMTRIRTMITLDEITIDLIEYDLVKVKIHNFSTCVSKIQGNTLHYDRFCGNIEGEGELNEYDSGGGHYIQNPADDLYYITGVYTYQYNEFVQLFTNLATHMEWINTIYEEIDPIDDNDFVEYEGCGEYSSFSRSWYDGKYYPWHVLVRITYFEESHTFSGTLIAPNLVLTDTKNKFFTNGDRVPVNNITVIVNGFLDVEEQITYEVEEIYSPLQRFFGEIPKQEGELGGDDIAVLHLKKEVTTNSIVQPVCVDWTGANLPPTFLSLENKVVHVGDRKTLEHEDDDVYIISTKFHHPEFCTRILAGHQQIHLSYDQFCAQNKDTAVLGRGDVGGGSYVRGLKDDLFYIKGIYIGDISSLGISVYTDLATHMEWLNTIDKKVNGKRQSPEARVPRFWDLDYESSLFGCTNDSTIRELRKKYTGCNLPKKTDNHIDYNVTCPNGYSRCIDHQFEFKWVPDNTKLLYWCDPENKYGSYSRVNLTSTCSGRNTWSRTIIKCYEKCKQFPLHLQHLNVSCSHMGYPVPCDGDLLEDTHVTTSCPLKYIWENETISSDVHCKKGKWEVKGNISRILPQCGPPKCSHTTYSFTGLTYESDLKLITP